MRKTDLTNTKLIQIILNFYSFAFGICILLNWIRINYFDINIYQYWSFKAEDPPWMPPPQSSIPILGKHHFGDFQLPIGWAKSVDPFELGNSNILPPVGMYFYRLLSFFPMTFSYLIFFAFSSFILIICLRKILLTFPGNLKLQALGVFVGLSLPIYIAYDRGASILFASSLIVYGYLIYSTNKKNKLIKVFATSMVVLGVSLKPYLLIVLMLWSFKNKSMIWKHFIPAIAATNLLLSFTFDGGLIHVIKNLIGGYLIQVGIDNPGWLYSGVSLSAGICRGSFLLLGAEDSLKFVEQYQKYSWIPGLLVIAILIIASYTFRKIWTNNFYIGLSLICIQLTVPVSMSYTLVWSTFGTTIILADLYNQKLNKIAKTRYMLSAVGFITLLLPLPFRNYLLIESILSAGTFILVIAISIIEYRKQKEVQ